MGPVDTLYTIYNGDDVVWSGELNRPVAGGEETIVLTGMGSMTFYFGTDDQVANATIGSKLADSTLNTPYRHLCWAFFNDCCTGSRECIPTMKFVLRKSPVFAFNANEVVGTYDYNPAHAKYYILNTLLEIPIAYLDGAGSFSDEADTLHTEGHGISILFGSQTPAMSYLESILGHTDGIIRWGNDGKFHPKLIRADEAVVDLPSFDENQMLEPLDMTRKSWFDTINEVKVQYAERLFLDYEPPPPPSGGKISFIDSWEFNNSWNPFFLKIAPTSVGTNLAHIVVTSPKMGGFISEMNALKIYTFAMSIESGMLVKIITDSIEPVYDDPVTGYKGSYSDLVAGGMPGYFMLGGCVTNPVTHVNIEEGFYTFFAAGGLLDASYPSGYLSIPGIGLTGKAGPNLEGTNINAVHYRTVGGTYIATVAVSSSIFSLSSYNLGTLKPYVDFAWSSDGSILVVANCENDPFDAGYPEVGTIRTFSVDGTGIIGSLLHTWQFKDDDVDRPFIIHMQGNIYFMVHSGVGAAGYMRTFSVDNTGNITSISSGMISGWGFCKPTKVDNYTIAVYCSEYVTGNRTIRTYRIEEDGTIGALLDTYDAAGMIPAPSSLIHVGRNCYICPTWVMFGGSYVYTWKIE